MVDFAAEIFDEFAWSVCAAGFVAWQLLALGASMGTQTVRVGLEDNIDFEPGVRGTNAYMVEKAVRMVRDLGREPSSVDEARECLNLG